MIHYHGTPIGGAKAEAARFLMGRHALVPFSYPSDLPIALDVCQSVCLDNGAFTHWKKGGDVNVADYYDWVHTVAGHPSLDWCLIPDKIDGTEQDNADLVTLWLRMGCAVESVPVWHLHESLEWLAWLVGKFRTVALGSSGQWATPGTEGWWRRMGEAMGGGVRRPGAATGSPARPAHAGPGNLHPPAAGECGQHQRGGQLRQPVALRQLPAADRQPAGRGHRSSDRSEQFRPALGVWRTAGEADRMSAEAKQILWLAGDYCRCCPAEIAEFLGLPVREIITTLRVYG